MLTSLRTPLVAILVSSISACAAHDEIELGERANALEPSTPPTLEWSVKNIVDQQVGPATDAFGNRRYAGISIAVIKNDARHLFHYGEAVRGSGQKPTSNTLYAIASVTKTFTATMLALYDRRGTVDLTDKLDDHTGYPLASPRTDLTLEDLATHDSGLARNPPGGEAGYRSGTYAGDMRLLMETLDTCINNPCEPRGNYDYSNYGFSVLAHVLASGGGGRSPANRGPSTTKTTARGLISERTERAHRAGDQPARHDQHEQQGVADRAFLRDRHVRVRRLR